MLKIVFFLGCVLALGCSFSNSTIRPTYFSSQPLTTIQFSIPIYFAEVQDQTQEKRQGIKKNELGWQSADIYTDPKPSMLLRRAIELELRLTGLQILEPLACTTEEIPQIYVTLEQYFVEPEVRLFLARICAVVQANVHIVFPKGKKIQKRFKGINSIYTPIFWYTSLPMEGEAIYNSALEGATKDFIQQAIPEICMALEKYPLILPMHTITKEKQ